MTVRDGDATDSRPARQIGLRYRREAGRIYVYDAGGIQRIGEALRGCEISNFFCLRPGTIQTREDDRREDADNRDDDKQFYQRESSLFSRATEKFHCHNGSIRGVPWRAIRTVHYFISHGIIGGIDSLYDVCYKLDHMKKAGTPGASKKQSAKKAVVPISFSFDSAALVKKLLSAAPERAREVLVRRFGLGSISERETLEAIGDRSSITRERVRQIEAAGLDAIRSHKAFKEAESAFEDIAKAIHKLGALVPEDELLTLLGKDEKTRNRFRFLLMLDSSFFRERETNDFLSRWHVDQKTAEHIHDALSRLYTSLPDEDVVSEADLLDHFLEELKDVNDAYKNEEVLKRWLSLSKRIGSNPLAEWGRTTAPAIRIKGIRDYAYLAIKRNGAPMHFADVAKSITTLFAKKAHIATTHNELIKDARFVLVGRGLYALTEWGYKPGVVRDVVREVLLADGPMKKEDIIEAVKKVRFVKDNTVLVNLNDPRHFKRMKDGRYAVA